MLLYKIGSVDVTYVGGQSQKPYYKWVCVCMYVCMMGSLGIAFVLPSHLAAATIRHKGSTHPHLHYCLHCCTSQLAVPTRTVHMDYTVYIIHHRTTFNVGHGLQTASPAVPIQLSR